MNNEFILFDRIQKIKSIIEQHKEENCYISYSGGKDSNVLDKLFDLALPDNKIPRVYCDTGIELNAVRDFVREKAEQDSRVIIIQPKVPIKKMLETVGYPFKSKAFAQYVNDFQKLNTKVENLPENSFYRTYAEGRRVVATGDNAGKISFDNCPKILRYIFYEGCSFPISDKCCDELKKKPLTTWQKEHDRSITITGISRSEGGRRCQASCTVFRKGELRRFNPLVPVTKEWEDWFIQEYDIKLPIIYYPPYNFERSGCKGCPFAVDIQKNLDVLKKYFPAEYKQCELIWKPVYAEYRKLNYRLKEKNDQLEF